MKFTWEDYAKGYAFEYVSIFNDNAPRLYQYMPPEDNKTLSVEVFF